MKKEGTIGAATLLAIAAVVGVSLQTGSNQTESGRNDRKAEPKQSKASITKNDTAREKPGCSALKDELEDFLAVENLVIPSQCYEPEDIPHREPPAGLAEKTADLKFVIALMPDPLHTHSSALFDQFAVAIQEGAQDEKYDFDSSWLPWDDDDTSYALLADEKASGREKEFKEAQPGIILFRKAPCSEETGSCNEKEIPRVYSGGLLVFVVGEDATHGIHREQFYNALEWISTLRHQADTKEERVAILGPTFSGSFPSLAQALSDRNKLENVHFSLGPGDAPLPIFSGSVSGKALAEFFQRSFPGEVSFHSFVQSDDDTLARFSKYLRKEQPEVDFCKVAILSEDETAYGGYRPASPSPAGKPEKIADCSKGTVGDHAVRLFYPRDISALRAAYQTKSLFDAGTPSQPAQAQQKSLPTDLADPSGKVHDSIRSYGGGQTPLGQESHLMEIVAALRDLHVRYILLRSSSTLDQLFLANFLRRGYPDGRIVILGSDLMFVRERGSTGLSGTMTLSTYPFFPLGRDWTEHQSLPASDRTFATDTSEGTYIAFRLLLNQQRMTTGKWDTNRCHVVEESHPGNIFLPPVVCGNDPAIVPIPDYSPPFWTLANQCGEMQLETGNKDEDCPYSGPATWLSVVGANRFWPLATLTDCTPESDPAARGNEPAEGRENSLNGCSARSDPAPKGTRRGDGRENDPGELPEMPVGMKMFLFALAGIALFHAWCCWSGSYTAKPAFLAHFASTGDWPHTLLVFSASCCIAFAAMIAGWGSGMFYAPPAGLKRPWFALGPVTFVWVIAWGAILANIRTSRLLFKDCEDTRKGFAEKTPDEASPGGPDSPGMTQQRFTAWNYVASLLFVAVTILFYLAFIVPVERVLLPENHVLTYWRAMHLASGVSPIWPLFSVLVGLYLSHWFTLHGLALFGPDRPRLPQMDLLELDDGKGNKRHFLKMFSQEHAAEEIEHAAAPWTWKIVKPAASLVVLFGGVAWAIAGGVPVRSLGAERYAFIFLVWLDVCCSLLIFETWRLYHAWEELRRLLTFLDRLPLRRTLAALRGFSWGSVWKMSGNVLEVRYKVISRQMECMNHNIAKLEEYLKSTSDCGAGKSLAALLSMREAGLEFADWYSKNYVKSRAGDLTTFTKFQKSVANASGTLLSQLLLPAWRKEQVSLLVAPAKDEKEESAAPNPPLAEPPHIRNAEEFVCLNYLGFIQNVLGRLRTMVMTIIALFMASAFAMSSYPFDPRQSLTAVLIGLFVIAGTVIVKVYAEMHRDATLSHVTNTKPGELGSEFWLKTLGFGLAPLFGLLTRIFPGMSDFVFAWLEPGLSSLK
jgi:hypothetical protein